MKMIPTTVADLEKLKARAKVLKRKLGIKHREALDRAAREAKYLHWHHAISCQAESEGSALTGSLRFYCESIVKDALKGETHYVFEQVPPLVFVADGKNNAFVVDPLSDEALVLAVAGVELPYEADGDSLAWTSKYRFKGDTVLLTGGGGQAFQFDVDAEALTNAMNEAKEPPDTGVERHDLETPAGQEFFAQVFGGVGLEPVTPEAVELLLAKGYERDVIEEAIAAGAMFSRPRVSLLYPTEEG